MMAYCSLPALCGHLNVLQKAHVCLCGERAGDGDRTRECQLGKLMPYHLATPAWNSDSDFTVMRAVGQASPL